MRGLDKFCLYPAFFCILFTACKNDTDLAWRSGIPNLFGDLLLSDLQLIDGNVFLRWEDRNWLLDAKTGEEKWVPPGFFVKILSNGNQWVVGDRSVRAYDPSSHDLLWQFPDSAGLSGNIEDLFSEDQGYWAVTEMTLFHISREGQLLDSLQIGKSEPGKSFHSSSIAYADSEKVIVFNSDRILRIAVDSLGIDWEFLLIGSARYCVANNERVYVMPDESIGVRALNIDSGQIEWNCCPPMRAGPVSELLLFEEILILGTPFAVYCFENNGGMLRWSSSEKQYPQERLPLGGQLIMNGTFYIGWKGYDKIRRYDTKTGKEHEPIELEGSLKSNFVIHAGIIIYVTGSEVVAQRIPPLE
jgi:outer membrane protein assembly factor BamB